MSLTRYFERRNGVKQIKCEYCDMVAQYDFVDDGGEWHYGCTNHWMKFRASRTIGPGHARHLEMGKDPPKRPEGYVPKPVDPTRLARPQIAPALAAEVARKPATMVASGQGPRPAKEPKARPPKEFQDMEAKGVEIKEPRPGSVLAITLDLIKNTGGATLDEINTAIGPKHDALKLLQWAHENKGYGWKMDPESKKIQVVYYAPTE